MGEKPDVKKVLVNLGEDAAKTVVKEVVRPYAEYYILQSPNKIDDIILPFLDQLESAIVDMLDKIDGEVG